MEANENKLAAALAAVTAYIQSEAEALILPPLGKPRARCFDPGNLWAMAGRQSLMQMRSLIQMKTFSRLR